MDILSDFNQKSERTNEPSKEQARQACKKTRVPAEGKEKKHTPSTSKFYFIAENS